MPACDGDRFVCDHILDQAHGWMDNTPVEAEIALGIASYPPTALLAKESPW